MEADTEKYLLGLDVSTFCIGFCIWNLTENKFETAGHIPLKKYKDWLDKVDHVCYILTELQKNTQTITHVAIEDIITKFISGRSNIKTIIKLAGFNYVIQRKCYEIFDTVPTLLTKGETVASKSETKRMKQSGFTSISGLLSFLENMRKKMFNNFGNKKDILYIKNFPHR